jgi:hypothetical protein
MIRHYNNIQLTPSPSPPIVEGRHLTQITAPKQLPVKENLGGISNAKLHFGRLKIEPLSIHWVLIVCLTHSTVLGDEHIKDILGNNIQILNILGRVSANDLIAGSFILS